jgi:mannose/fructose/N-acetylgalactosamine-specific phosphotransferase system component IIC
MAETIAVEGQTYLKRNPLGVLGLIVITLGIYFLYWYYTINKEIQRFEHDETISPVRSLMAMLFGWIIIVPPFIALYNTAKHIQTIEERRAIQPRLEPALVIVIMLLVAIGNGLYIQEHLNRIWDRAATAGALPAAGLPPAPPMPE